LFKSNNSDFDKYGKVRKMPHSHGHGGHSHGGKKDIWTKWNQVGEYFDALGTAYFFIGTVDNIKDLIEFAMGTYSHCREFCIGYGVGVWRGLLSWDFKSAIPRPRTRE
jgi:hypothetical protein